MPPVRCRLKAFEVPRVIRALHDVFSTVAELFSSPVRGKGYRASYAFIPVASIFHGLRGFYFDFSEFLNAGVRGTLPIRGHGKGDISLASLANGGELNVETTVVEVEVEKRRVPAIALIMETKEPLLGVGALEAMGFRVDSTTGRLEATRGYAVRAYGVLEVH